MADQAALPSSFQPTTDNAAVPSLPPPPPTPPPPPPPEPSTSGAKRKAEDDASDSASISSVSTDSEDEAHLTQAQLRAQLIADGYQPSANPLVPQSALPGNSRPATATTVNSLHSNEVSTPPSGMLASRGRLRHELPPDARPDVTHHELNSHLEEGRARWLLKSEAAMSPAEKATLAKIKMQVRDYTPKDWINPLASKEFAALSDMGPQQPSTERRILGSIAYCMSYDQTVIIAGRPFANDAEFPSSGTELYLEDGSPLGVIWDCIGSSAAPIFVVGFVDWEAVQGLQLENVPDMQMHIRTHVYTAPSPNNPPSNNDTPNNNAGEIKAEAGLDSDSDDDDSSDDSDSSSEDDEGSRNGEDAQPPNPDSNSAVATSTDSSIPPGLMSLIKTEPATVNSNAESSSAIKAGDTAIEMHQTDEKVNPLDLDYIALPSSPPPMNGDEMKVDDEDDKEVAQKQILISNNTGTVDTPALNAANSNNDIEELTPAYNTVDLLETARKAEINLVYFILGRSTNTMTSIDRMMRDCNFADGAEFDPDNPYASEEEQDTKKKEKPGRGGRAARGRGRDENARGRRNDRGRDFPPRDFGDRDFRRGGRDGGRGRGRGRSGYYDRDSQSQASSNYGHLPSPAPYQYGRHYESQWPVPQNAFALGSRPATPQTPASSTGPVRFADLAAQFQGRFPPPLPPPPPPGQYPYPPPPLQTQHQGHAAYFQYQQQQYQQQQYQQSQNPQAQYQQTQYQQPQYQQPQYGQAQQQAYAATGFAGYPAQTQATANYSALPHMQTTTGNSFTQSLLDSSRNGSLQAATAAPQIAPQTAPAASVYQVTDPRDAAAISAPGPPTDADIQRWQSTYGAQPPRNNNRFSGAYDRR